MHILTKCVLVCMQDAGCLGAGDALEPCYTVTQQYATSSAHMRLPKVVPCHLWTNIVPTAAAEQPVLHPGRCHAFGK
jgi:hypothetical protein